MRVTSFSHVGITVSSFNTAVRFYSDVFGASLVGVSDIPADRARTFFGVDAAEPSGKIGWLRLPGGAVVEIFEFQPQQPPATVLWNRPGITHLAVNVHDTSAWHLHLMSKGVEIVSPPERSPRGHTFFFARDPDGNLIELMDAKHMRHVLRWLGPLGGVLFRHTLYRQYYRPGHSG